MVTRMQICGLLLTVLVLHLQSMTAQEPATGALRLRLALPESSVCTMQREIGLELFLTNHDSKDVELTEKGFGTGITYIALYDSANGSFRGGVLSTVGDWLPALNQAAMKRLSTGQSIHTFMMIALPQNLFDRAGFYKIQIRYSGLARDGHGIDKAVEVVSNWAILDMERCADEQLSSQ